MQVFVKVHNLGWVGRRVVYYQMYIPRALWHLGIVLNPVESCIVSPLWHSENPSVGLKVLFLILMLPQHTEKINRSDRHEPWKNQ